MIIIHKKEVLSRQHIYFHFIQHPFKHPPGPIAEAQNQYTITLGITKNEKTRTK